MKENKFIRTSVIYLKGIVSALILLIVTQYFTLLIFIPPAFSARRRKLFYKKNLKWLARFILKTHLNVRTQYINNYNEDFSKPAVIIANHQTFLDVPVTFSLSYKLFVITNDWLKNTFFNFFMKKYLDNISTTEGNEKMIKEAGEFIKNGYFPLIFPEGIRTKGTKIIRFHKGAFLMSAVLNTEIIPIVICGSEQIHKRKWFYFKNGLLKVYIGKRIPPCNPDSHDEIRNQAKSVTEEFRKIYITLQNNNLPE